MKSSRLFITAGALVLGVVGIFATKPNKKFTTTTGNFVNGLVSGITAGSIPVGTTSGLFTIASSFNKTVLLVTAGASKSKIGTLRTNSSGSSHILYYVP